MTTSAKDKRGSQRSGMWQLLIGEEAWRSFSPHTAKTHTELQRSERKKKQQKWRRGGVKKKTSSQTKMGRWSSKWVAPFFLLCILLSLQRIQGNEESTTSRTLKQELGDAVEVHCSRERSRAAWKIIEEYLMPFVDKERYQLSRRCRLHPDNDLYRDQEQHKIRLDINEWQCGYCKKSFYEEKHLDKHFDNRHYNLLNVSHSRCLADVCGALHCDHVMDIPQKTKCNPAAAARNHHLCESLADSCFPVKEGPSASHLHEFFLRQFCDAHTCKGNQKPFSRGRKKRKNIFYIIISIFTILLLLLFYTYMYLYQRGMKRGPQKLIRVSQSGRKKKPS